MGKNKKKTTNPEKVKEEVKVEEVSTESSEPIKEDVSIEEPTLNNEDPEKETVLEPADDEEKVEEITEDNENTTEETEVSEIDEISNEANNELPTETVEKEEHLNSLLMSMEDVEKAKIESIKEKERLDALARAKALEEEKKRALEEERRNSRKLTKEEKKKIIIIASVVIVVLIIGLIIYFNTWGSSKFRLDRLGYKENEIQTIIEHTNKKNLRYLYKVGYTKNVPTLVTTKGFKKDNFNKYIDYYNKYKKINNTDLIKVVNNGADSYKYNQFLMDILNSKEFKVSNRDKYMAYHSSNKDASYEDVIFLINKNISYKHSDMLVMIAKEEYFIYSRLSRYIDYSENNDKLTSKEVVADVNANIDRPFYDGIKEAKVNNSKLVLINKYYKLHQNYHSNGDLVDVSTDYSNKYGQKMSVEAYDNFKKLVDDASKEGLYIKINNGYRDYSQQEFSYNESVIANSLEWTDKRSARPGHSEHQTGFAIDVNVAGIYTNNLFDGTNESNWMQKNAYKYGFILRYPKDKEKLTGYNYMSWHYRYVGVDAAKEIYERNITLEEYYAYFIEKQ